VVTIRLSGTVTAEKLNFVFERLVAGQLNVNKHRGEIKLCFLKLIVVRRRSSISLFKVRGQLPFASRRSAFASSPAPPVRHQTLVGSPADLLRRLRQQ